MLRKLAAENFFSICDRQELDLTIASNATDADERFARPSNSFSARLPRVVALFGANASGKTNVLKAISFVQHFITHSFLWPQDGEGVFLPFLTDEKRQSPTTLFVEFDLEFVPGEERTTFQYELEICSYGTKVLREVLRYRPERRMRRLFERTEDGIHASSDFDFPKSDPVRGKIRSNSSVISTLAQFNHDFSMQFLDAFGLFVSNVNLSGKYRFDYEDATKSYDKVPECFDDLKSHIFRFDLGITDVQLKKTTDGLVPQFVHEGLDDIVDWPFESQGTQNFYRLYPTLWGALISGGVAIIDELDNDIHPILLPEIIREFQDGDRNPLNAQLIFSCHNATLMEHLTKEEVVFTEKDCAGASSIYRLANVQGVRRDTNIYAKYLMGAFGAIPDIG